MGQPAYHVGKIILVVPKVDHLYSAGPRSRHSLVHQIDRDDRVDPFLLGNATRHSPIGPSPKISSEPPSGTPAYSTACQAVGKTSER